jgi:hypothetical protein
MVSTNIQWRCAVLGVLIFVPLVVLFLLDPIPQDPGYHLFADTRAFWGIPNFFDMASNLPFLIVGLMGLRFVVKDRSGSPRVEWSVLFVGVMLVSFGSSWYHLQPSNDSLVWDRLPMAVGFMGLLDALIGEHISEPLARRLLAPLVILGIASVLCWKWTGDLRLYVWVQFVPLLTIPAMFLLFVGRYSHRWLLLVAFGGYALAKVTEAYDEVIFTATGGMFSGHSIKHVLAAAACYSILVMLAKRRGR